MISPGGHRVLVRPEKVEEVTESGIVIPKTIQANEQRHVTKGEVLEIGSTAWKEFGDEDWCKVGDTVVFAKYGGLTVEDEETGEELRILNDEDVVAVLTRGGSK